MHNWAIDVQQVCVPRRATKDGRADVLLGLQRVALSGRDGQILRLVRTRAGSYDRAGWRHRRQHGTLMHPRASLRNVGSSEAAARPREHVVLLILSSIQPGCSTRDRQPKANDTGSGL